MFGRVKRVAQSTARGVCGVATSINWGGLWCWTAQATSSAKTAFFGFWSKNAVVAMKKRTVSGFRALVKRRPGWKRVAGPLRFLKGVSLNSLKRRATRPIRRRTVSLLSGTLKRIPGWGRIARPLVAAKERLPKSRGIGKAFSITKEIASWLV